MTARINEAGLLPMQLLDTQTEKYKAEANAKFQARESPGTETGVSSHGKEGAGLVKQHSQPFP